MLYDKDGSTLVHTLWKQPSLKVTKTNLQISPGVRIYWQSDMNTNSDVTPCMVKYLNIEYDIYVVTIKTNIKNMTYM